VVKWLGIRMGERGGWGGTKHVDGVGWDVVGRATRVCAVRCHALLFQLRHTHNGALCTCAL
jgi:hypothetical protein